MDATQTAWIVFLAGVVPAVVIALAGVVPLARRALTLRARIGRYETLPVVVRIGAANARIALHAPAFAAAGAATTRARLAMTAISEARSSLLASMASVKAMWVLR